MPNAAPSKEEIKIMMKQSLRLPHVFSLRGKSDAVIRELEDIRQNQLGEWINLPSIGRELFLLLDPNGCATLDGTHLTYDYEYGLRYERSEKGGGERV